jgi:serine acetyltransferase
VFSALGRQVFAGNVPGRDAHGDVSCGDVADDDGVGANLGIIVSGDTVIGDDCILRNGVTIGMKKIGEPGSPVIGNRVEIGAGAKILGKIHIGDDAQIGANAVVIRDVPAGHIAVGIPARNIPRKDLPSQG